MREFVKYNAFVERTAVFRLSCESNRFKLADENFIFNIVMNFVKQSDKEKN